ncbi:MAG: hypothetical protein IJ730_02230 [Alphaproteobacteria bacterium]|nr:hypothetical protein [Alphaproteobacteria bacterium]
MMNLISAKNKHPLKEKAVKECLNAYRDTLEEEDIKSILILHTLNPIVTNAWNPDFTTGFLDNFKAWNSAKAAKILTTMLICPTKAILQRIYDRSYPISAYAFFSIESMRKSIGIVKSNITSAYVSAITGREDTNIKQKLACLKAQAICLYDHLTSVVKYKDPVGAYSGNYGKPILPLEYIGGTVTVQLHNPRYLENKEKIEIFAKFQEALYKEINWEDEKSKISNFFDIVSLTIAFMSIK